jgi:hypothetical protein
MGEETVRLAREAGAASTNPFIRSALSLGSENRLATTS